MVCEEFISKLVQRLDRLHAKTDSEKNHRQQNKPGAQPVIDNLDYRGLWILFKLSWDFHQDYFPYEISCAAGRGRNLITAASPGALPFPFWALVISL